ncbi:MAG: hemerythrin family protein [candidate division Zixibacteria bacterium]|nr:hemerythrin family protein [candidate division Zixibacteria bacterium]
MRVKFTDDLLTGHEQIDNQHKEWFARLDNFWRAAREGKSREEVTRAVTFLWEYVKTHFADEEAIQKEIDYPDYEKHKLQHREFETQIDSLVNRLQELGADHSIAVETLNLMLEWVVKHIKYSDKILVAYIRSTSKPTPVSTL